MEMWLIRLRFNGQSLALLSEADRTEDAVSEVRRSIAGLTGTPDPNIRILSVTQVRVTGEELEVTKS